MDNITKGQVAKRVSPSAAMKTKVDWRSGTRMVHKHRECDKQTVIRSAGKRRRVNGTLANKNAEIQETLRQIGGVAPTVYEGKLHEVAGAENKDFDITLVNCMGGRCREQGYNECNCGSSISRRSNMAFVKRAVGRRIEMNRPYHHLG